MIFSITTALALALVVGFALTMGGAIAAEDGPVEMAQVTMWCIAAACALLMFPRIPDDVTPVSAARVPAGNGDENADDNAPGTRDRAASWFTAWLGVMALLATARELDLHVVANPETLGAWGVRYRLDWWADFGVPIGPKLLWAGVFLVIGTAVVFPILRAWPTLARALKRRPLVLAMGVLSGLGLFIGWAWDDLFREWTSAYGPYIEEGAELMGSWAYLVAVGLLVWRGRSERW